MKIKIESELSFPYNVNVECPLGDEDLCESFGSILLEDTLLVSNEWFSNTSDVFIARSSFGGVNDIQKWRLRQLAVDKALVPRVRELLISHGVSQLQQWFVRSNVLLNKDPLLWVAYWLTVRFENDELIFDEKTALRPGPRPVHWPRPESF